MRIMISASNGYSLINFRGDLIKEMVARGHEVICTSMEPEAQMEEMLSFLGAAYYRINGTRTGINPLSCLKTLLSYILAIRAIQPDLCFFYMSKPIAFGGLAASFCRVKRMVVFVTGLEVAFYSRGLKNFMVRSVLRLFYRWVHRRCESVFFMNRDDYRKMLQWRLVNKAQAILVNGSGVNMEYFARKPLPETDLVCMTARLVWSKGIREYVEAARIVRKKYPRIRFLLVGGMDENPEALTPQEVRELSEEENIDYCGGSTDVRPYLEVCSIFVLPSYHEGSGRSILEAEAVGRPIITTDVPGCKETVIEGYNGFLIPPQDAQALAERILLLIEHKEIMKRMAYHSYIFCTRKYDVNKVNDVFIKRMGL